MLTGGKGLIHDCGTGRAIGYFLEALVILGLYGKRPLAITLRGTSHVSHNWPFSARIHNFGERLAVDLPPTFA